MFYLFVLDRATDKAKPESPKTNAAYKSLPTQVRKVFMLYYSRHFIVICHRFSKEIL